MNYQYNVHRGIENYKNNTKNYIIAAVATVGLILAVVVPVSAAKPTNTGCFGTDRAAYANVNGSLGHDVGGVGYYASQRAGDNGAINQAYKTSCGGDPTQ